MGANSGAYWESPGGELEDVKLLDYTGDGTNDRVLALGAVFDTVKIIMKGNLMTSVDHLAVAYAVREDHQVFYHKGTVDAVRHVGGSFANGMFQGFNPARDSVVLGSTGGTSIGTNLDATGYRLVAKKFRSMA